MASRESVRKWFHKFSTIISMKFLRMVLGRCINKPLIIVDRGPWYRWTLERLGLKYQYQRFGLRNRVEEVLRIPKTENKKALQQHKNDRGHSLCSSNSDNQKPAHNN
jgi:transposase-like protein